MPKHRLHLFAIAIAIAAGSAARSEAQEAPPSSATESAAAGAPRPIHRHLGRGGFVGHSAVIKVPEDFRLVTDPDGLSVQVTPIGEFASVAVVSIGLDEIVLKSTSDVAFFYTVNGVRDTFKDWQVMVQSGEYTPESADAKIPEYLSVEQRGYMIHNGTYNADGTVNMQTAERVGWIKVWRDREEAIKASAEKAAAQHAAQSGGQGRPGQRP